MSAPALKSDLRTTVPSRLWLAARLAMLVLLCALAWVLLRRVPLRQARSMPAPASFAHIEAWTAYGGSWSVDAREIRSNSEERGAKLMSRLGEWQDFEVDADVQIAEPFGEAGLILRSSGEEEGVDAYHGYFVGFRTMDSSLEIGRADDGWRSLVHTRLPANASPQEWIHLRVATVGCQIGVQLTALSGQQTASVIEDRDCIRSGRFGLRSYLSSARWRNLRVERADSATMQALQQAANESIRANQQRDDMILDEPTDPVNADLYNASVRNEVARHEVQPGVTPILDYLYSPGRHPNVTLQGVVIATPPLADIQDDTGALIVPNIDPKTPIKLGDMVVAQGTVVSERFRSRLENAKIRVLWSDMPIPPLAVTAAQLNGGTYRGRFVEIEGTLVTTLEQHGVEQHGDLELILRDRDQIFNAVGTRDLHFSPTRMEPGSRLRLRGTTTSLSQYTEGIYPFTVLANSAELISTPPWWSPRHMAEIILACFLLFALVLWVLHRLRDWQMKTVLREREQLAYEIHDTLAQSFAGIAYQLQAASLEQRGEEQIKSRIQDTLTMVDLSHKEASRTIAALRPQYHDAADMVVALREIAERLIDGGKLDIVTHFEGKSWVLPIPVTDALFRIGQEAVVNALQHAGCKQLTISLRLAMKTAQLTVHDDGIGIPEVGAQKGLGIAGMRNRAARIKADFKLESHAGSGTLMTVTAPIPLAGGFFSRMRSMIKASFFGTAKGERA